MLSRSLPHQVRGHLERIIRAKTALGVYPAPLLRVPLKHETAAAVLQTIQYRLPRVHPQFNFRHFYDPGLTNPETIAYWLVELAQQTREDFCWDNADRPPGPEHYGQCDPHRRQIVALFEAFIVGIAGDSRGTDPLKVYKDRIGDLLGEGARNQRREIDRFVRSIEVGAAGLEVRQAIAQNLCGPVFFLISERNAGSH